MRSQRRVCFRHPVFCFEHVLWPNQNSDVIDRAARDASSGAGPTQFPTQVAQDLAYHVSGFQHQPQDQSGGRDQIGGQDVSSGRVLRIRQNRRGGRAEMHKAAKTHLAAKPQVAATWPHASVYLPAKDDFHERVLRMVSRLHFKGRQLVARPIRLASADRGWGLVLEVTGSVALLASRRPRLAGRWSVECSAASSPCAKCRNGMMRYLFRTSEHARTGRD